MLYFPGTRAGFFRFFLSFVPVLFSAPVEGSGQNVNPPSRVSAGPADPGARHIRFSRRSTPLSARGPDRAESLGSANDPRLHANGSRRVRHGNARPPEPARGVGGERVGWMGEVVAFRGANPPRRRTARPGRSTRSDVPSFWNDSDKNVAL